MNPFYPLGTTEREISYGQPRECIACHERPPIRGMNVCGECVNFDEDWDDEERGNLDNHTTSTSNFGPDPNQH